MALLLAVLARHGGRDSPPLTRLSRVLKKTDSFAHMVLQQLMDSRAGRRPERADEGVDLQPALRWFIEPARAGDPLARLEELADSHRSSSEAFEAMVCFHFATASLPRGELVGVADRLFYLLSRSEPRSGRAFVLLPTLIHFITDYTLDIEEHLARPEIARHFSAADRACVSAMGYNARGETWPKAARELAALRERSVAELAFGAYLLVIRLGAMPGLAIYARKYLVDLEQTYAPDLRRAPAAECAVFLKSEPLGAELCEVLRARGCAEVNLLSLLERALVLVTSGEVRRRRRAPGGDDEWTDAEIQKVAWRFNAWGLGHDICGLLAPVFARRPGAAELRRHVSVLAEWLAAPALHPALGDMLVNEMLLVASDAELSA